MARIKKAQMGRKLPSGASSASAERDYRRADSLEKSQRNWKGKDYWDYNVKNPGKKLPTQVADSLRKEGDRKTKATGGVPQRYRLTKEDFQKRGGGKLKKAKKGGSFPDLNKDGKITRADILKGRGVIRKGGTVKKARSGATLSPSKKSTSSKLASYGRPLGKNLTGKLKSGGKLKMGGKCRGGCY